MFALSLACGLSGQVWRVGQEACRWSVVCRGEKGEWVKGQSAGVVCRGEIAVWVKRPVGGVWPVRSKSLRGSRGLSLECGLSGRNRCVGQENCRRSVVCRGEKGEWVKGPVGGCGLSGQVWRVGQGNCRRSVVCRVKIAAWVKGPVGGVWSVRAKSLSGSRELLAECGLSGRNR